MRCPSVRKKSSHDVTEPEVPKDQQLWRDLTAFWLLGLCNNYGYVVMLSAAHDIIGSFGGGHDDDTTTETDPTVRSCNVISTGAILLADIIPALLVKFSVPFIPFHVHSRVLACCILSAIGFLLVAFAETEWLAILGVVSTSLSSGLGEVTFLAYSSVYNKNVVSTWSSGTGGAGIIGSISYAGLTAVGLSPMNTLLIMLIVPALEAVAFWVVLRHPNKVLSDPTLAKEREASSNTSKEDLEGSSSSTPLNEDEKPLIGFKQKLYYVPSLLKFIIPLTLVYLFEYFINQGLYELVHFPDIWLSQKDIYRWLQVDYQIGVFISRSSVNLVSIDKIWLMAVFQFVNVVYFLFEIFYFFTPNIWIIFAIVLWEGLLGGGAYVNTFYKISKDIHPARREFSLALTSMSDSVGIALAGVFAIPTHNAICKLPSPIR